MFFLPTYTFLTPREFKYYIHVGMTSMLIAFVEIYLLSALDQVASFHVPPNEDDKAWPGRLPSATTQHPLFNILMQNIIIKKRY